MTISQLKNSLSAYLKKVRGGETVMILDRQEPIAMLERIDSADHPEGRLARLEQAGAVRRPRAPIDAKSLASLELPKPRASVVDALLAERQDGR
ncbi:MAG: hypothetical protein RIC56_04965 [Pseudomonadales bacterium]